MRVLLVEPDQGWLDERRRRGVDARDEVWDGVMHVPPAPVTEHLRVETRLAEVLGPLARARGLEAFHGLAVLDPRDHERNYRIPDVAIVDPRHLLRAGTEGPVELLIEVLSPHDESRDKFAFYAQRAVQEIWLIDPATRGVELYVLRGGQYFMIAPHLDGSVRAPALGIELRTVAGPKLQITWSDGAAEI